MARNEGNKEIARYLNLAESTAKIHVRNLLKKLRVQVAIDAGGNRPGERD